MGYVHHWFSFPRRLYRQRVRDRASWPDFCAELARDGTIDGVDVPSVYLDKGWPHVQRWFRPLDGVLFGPPETSSDGHVNRKKLWEATPTLALEPRPFRTERPHPDALLDFHESRDITGFLYSWLEITRAVGQLMGRPWEAKPVQVQGHLFMMGLAFEKSAIGAADLDASFELVDAWFGSLGRAQLEAYADAERHGFDPFDFEIAPGFAYAAVRFFTAQVTGGEELGFAHVTR